MLVCGNTVLIRLEICFDLKKYLVRMWPSMSSHRENSSRVLLIIREGTVIFPGYFNVKNARLAYFTSLLEEAFKIFAYEFNVSLAYGWYIA